MCLIDKFVDFINICKSVWCMLHTLFTWVGRIAAITPDCKSGGFTFDGSSPSLSTNYIKYL